MQWLTNYVLSEARARDLWEYEPARTNFSTSETEVLSGEINISSDPNSVLFVKDALSLTR